MGSKWRSLKVSELQREGILLVEDGNHGEYRPRPDEFDSIGVAFIRAADIDKGAVLFESASKINDRARERITKGIGAPGDVLLSHKGTVGKLALVSEDAPAFVCSPQTTFWRALDVNVLDRKYLYAFMRSPEFRSQLATRAGETDMAPYVSLTSQRGLTVALPPIPEQRAIAHILGTLDDKIELNRRRNETLEAMARALFKDWFVDFGPVRAKMEGREPYLPADLWQLFPDSLAEDGKPQRWEFRSIYDFANVIYGAPFASEQFNTDEAGLPLIRIRDLASHEPGIWTEQVHPKGHLIQPGDIVVGMDGEFRLHVWKGQPAWLNQRVCHFEPLPEVPSAFLSEALVEPLAFFERGKVGTTVIHLGKGDIDTFRLLHPGEKALKAFGDLAEPWMAGTVRNALETRTLAYLRDVLLPKLISGELRIKDAERFMEERAA